MVSAGSFDHGQEVKKMSQRTYVGLWLTVVFVSVLLFLSGALSEMVLAVTGFVVLWLVFAGMTSLQPSTLTHQKKVSPNLKTGPPKAPATRTQQHYERFLQPWFFRDGPDSRRPGRH